MKAGRELNARVAEKVMGLCIHVWEIEFADNDLAGEWFATCEKCSTKRSGAYPMLTPRDNLAYRYSESMLAAWEVVEKLRADGWEFHLDSVGFNNDIEGEWRTFFTYTDEDDLAHDAHVFADGDTAPHAICLAALKALDHTP